MNTLRISEMFTSIEGEGPYTGHPMFFIRLFGCNFTCQGFSNPTKDKVVYLKQDNREGDKFNVGCDSAYSWDPAFKDQTSDISVYDLAKLIEREAAKGRIICFTGGEPMLWQAKLAEVFKQIADNDFEKEEKPSLHFLFESNGTQPVTLEFKLSLIELSLSRYVKTTMAVSPKLSNSGEAWEEAIKPEVVEGYRRTFGEVYLKFVCDGSVDNFNEIEIAVDQYNENRSFKKWKLNTWLMPMGASEEQQQGIMERVANICVEHGYKFCARVHVWVYGNKKGT